MAKQQKEPSEALRYIHVDEFLSQKPELSEHDKEGFRVYLKVKGMTYHFSFADFEKELQNFFNRKR